MQLQNDISKNLMKLDSKVNFKEDIWQREGGGGGISRIIKNGFIFEKGGINFSAVYGILPDNILRTLQVPKSKFFATGVSIVIHPQSPMVPIIHMNVRYFEMSNSISWFGGGIDLTPHYINKKDGQYFHQWLKRSCDKHHSSYYPKFKAWADDYFFLKHRNESRGIGGIFFDRLEENENFSLSERFGFVISISEIFSPLYNNLVNKNKNLKYGSREILWQKIRRGRYVEFNLLWDKGTQFGLDTNGRTESILISMPPSAVWEYNFIPLPNSKEEKTLKLLSKKINWINMEN